MGRKRPKKAPGEEELESARKRREGVRKGAEKFLRKKYGDSWESKREDRRNHRARRAMGRLSRELYTDLLSKRFGVGDCPDGLDMGHVLSRTFMESPDDIHSYRDDAASFAKGRSTREILSDEATGLPELRKVMDYGLTLGSLITDHDIKGYGFMVYILSCATAIARHGDQLDHSVGKNGMIRNLDRVIGNDLVPREYQPLLRKARYLLGNRE